MLHLTLHIFSNTHLINVLKLRFCYQGNEMTPRLVTILKQGVTSESPLKENNTWKKT